MQNCQQQLECRQGNWTVSNTENNVKNKITLQNHFNLVFAKYASLVMKNHIKSALRDISPKSLQQNPLLALVFTTF